MLGKILLYKLDEGTGLLLTQTNEKYSFDIESWSDFDHMPSTGMKVDFEVENGTIAFMKKHQGSTEQTANPSQKSPLEETPLQENEQDNAFRDVDLEHLSVKTVEEGTMDRTMDLFFQDLTSTVDKFQHRSSSEERQQLDYFAAKRFLFTAYNMLKEIDNKLVDQSLTSLLENLREIEDVHKLYKRSKTQPRIAFQNIFLKYTRYKEAKHRLEYNISEMNRLKGKANALDKEIKEKNELLLKLDKKSQRLSEVVVAYKRMRRLYVDTIDHIGNLREENEKLVPITNEYYDEFFEDFVSKFNRSYEDNMRLIKQILDSLSYSFDEVMWERAKLSMSIQQYFENSNIDGDFSTLTFLKYYLRSLDQTKLSKENQALLRLQKYLEKKRNHATV